MQSPKSRFIESQYNQLLLKIEPIRKEIDELKNWELNRSHEASHKLFVSNQNVFFEILEKIRLYLKIVLEKALNQDSDPSWNFYWYLNKCAENNTSVHSYSPQRIAQDFDGIMLKVAKMTAIEQEKAEIEFIQATNKFTNDQLTSDVRELKNLVVKLAQQNQMKKGQNREFTPALFNKN